jgi:hypothetical protein
MSGRFVTILATVLLAFALVQAEETESTDKSNVRHEASQATSAAVGTLVNGVNDQLHTPGFQWLDALVALILGKAMCFDGEFIFKYLLVAVVSIFSYLLTMQVVTQSHADFGLVLSIVVSTEVALFVAFIAWLGFNGLRYLIGLTVGFMIAYYFHMLMAQHVSAAVANHWAFIVFAGNICVLAGVIPFSTFGRGHHRAMALIFCFVGSALITSAMSFFFLLLAQHWNFLGQHLGCDVPTEKPYWVDFLLALCYAGTKTVGVWANCTCKANTVKLLGMVWGVDRIVARLVWFALFITGYVVQVKLDKKKQKKLKDSSAKATAAQAEGPPGFLGSISGKFKKGAAGSKHEPLLC